MKTVNNPGDFLNNEIIKRNACLLSVELTDYNYQHVFIYKKRKYNNEYMIVENCLCVTL